MKSIANCGCSDETTLLPSRFALDVDKTIQSLQEQEDTDGNFQITIEDNGPKVSEMTEVLVMILANSFSSRSFPLEPQPRMGINERKSAEIICSPTSTRSCT